MKLDTQEVKIVKELIKDPRSSDNAISKRTGIPTMSVNRKRKKLEEKGLLSYYTHLRTGEEGTKIFHARQIYIIQLRSGITREEYFKYIKKNTELKIASSHHIEESYIGEQNGRLAIIMIVEAKTESDLMDIFNGVIIKQLKKNFGEHAVTNISTARITLPLIRFHNYMPHINMENGKLKNNWPDELIFVDKPENGNINHQDLKNYFEEEE